jgi:hypothetical protein
MERKGENLLRTKTVMSTDALKLLCFELLDISQQAEACHVRG